MGNTGVVRTNLQSDLLREQGAGGSNPVRANQLRVLSGAAIREAVDLDIPLSIRWRWVNFNQLFLTLRGSMLGSACRRYL